MINRRKQIVVAGIGVDVGKTTVSAILARMLNADYWKPISCSPEAQSDSAQVRHLLKGSGATCHQEAYVFTDAVSPHEAARRAGVVMDTASLSPPKTKRHLIIEMAGGIFVPINNTTVTIDVFAEWKAAWVLVSKTYLGSINHTLLTVEALRRRNVDVMGIIFNGEKCQSTESVVCELAALPVLGELRPEQEINVEVIERYSTQWSQQEPWNTLQS